MPRRLPLPVEVLAAFAASALALWAAIGWLAYDAHHDAIDAANAANSNLARSIAEYEESSVRAVDLSLRLLRDEWARGRTSFDATVARHEDYLRKEKVIQVAVVDLAGDLLYSRLPLTGSPNFADRDYFRLQKGAGSDELYVSRPVLGRITGQWAIQFSLPILDDQGRFAGLIGLGLHHIQAEGRTNKEIAVALGLSDKTVKNYLSNAFQKLQVTRRSQAAALFARGLPDRD